jgi:hypothetical protein
VRVAAPRAKHATKEKAMHGIIYIIGLIVVVMAIISFIA